MKKQIVKDTLALVVITLVAALCLSFVYRITSGKIAEAEEKEKKDSYFQVSQDAAGFEPIDGDAIAAFNASHSKAAVLEAYEAKNEKGETVGAVASVVSHNGYGGDIVLSVGVGADGAVTGVKVTSMSETSGLGANCQSGEWTAQFVGKTADEIGYVKNGNPDGDQIDAITGATITTKAVLDAVNYGAAFCREYLSLR